MATRKILLAKAINNGDTSASITSTPVNISDFVYIAVQAVWTGTTTGTITAETSIDYNPDTNTAGNWTALGGISITPAGSAGSGIGKPSGFFTPEPWVRIVYTRTSGTGTLNAWVAGNE